MAVDITGGTESNPLNAARYRRKQRVKKTNVPVTSPESQCAVHCGYLIAFVV